MPTPIDPLRAHGFKGKYKGRPPKRTEEPERDVLDDLPDQPRKKKAAGRPSADPEMYAMRVAAAGFERLTPEQARRVLRYLEERFCPEEGGDDK